MKPTIELTEKQRLQAALFVLLHQCGKIERFEDEPDEKPNLNLVIDIPDDILKLFFSTELYTYNHGTKLTLSLSNFSVKRLQPIVNPKHSYVLTLRRYIGLSGDGIQDIWSEPVNKDEQQLTHIEAYERNASLKASDPQGERRKWILKEDYENELRWAENEK